jgi:small subunit ribosomal protein S8e
MAKLQANSKRKSTGGKYHRLKGKVKSQLGNEMLEIGIGDKKSKKVRGMGGTLKNRAVLVKEANVLDSKSGKYQKAEIKSVSGNPANLHFVRRNTITKGAIIETSAGSARVTSRPGQTGTINAILVEKTAPKPTTDITKMPEAPKPETASVAEAKTD